MHAALLHLEASLKQQPSPAPLCLPAQILLLSRDEVSMLVVSYADVKRCIQNSYAELRARSTGSGGPMQRSKSKPELQRQADKGGAGSAGGYY